MKIKNKKLISLLLLGCLVLSLAGCREKPRELDEDTNPMQQEENLQQEADKEETQDHLQKENNEKDSLEAIIEEEEKPVILSFWVSWDEESKEQLDILENVYKLLQEDVILVGIHTTSFDTASKEEIRAYIGEKEFSFPILLDEEGEKSQSYYVGNFPTTVFLDEEGEVVKSFTTLIEEDGVLDQIKIMLEER